VNRDALSVAARLLENEIVTVCAACEKEHGPVPVSPGVLKSHSMCKRHAQAQWSDVLTPEEFDSLEFAPDLSEVPAGPATTRAS
jgi:hypothetical protein